MILSSLRPGRRAVALSALLLASCAPRPGDDLSADESAVTESADVRIEKRMKVDLAEVSALGLRQHDGALELLAVGDDDAKVAVATSDALEFDVRRAPGKGPSQWEAVASDATARVFVLKENPGSILVFDPKLKTTEAEIELTVSGKRWEDENSRGEGLVLMKNGHVLVLKEKKPLEIVEFGPEGEAPAGYHVGVAVSTNDTFPLPDEGKRRYHVLREWEIGETSASLAQDASDLCVGPDGLLYLLSDQSRTISVIEQHLGAEEARFKFDTTWHLPAEIEKPEGLVILPDGRPVVAVDAPDEGKTIFVLSRLVRPPRRAR